MCRYKLKQLSLISLFAILGSLSWQALAERKPVTYTIKCTCPTDKPINNKNCLLGAQDNWMRVQATYRSFSKFGSSHDSIILFPETSIKNGQLTLMLPYPQPDKFRLELHAYTGCFSCRKYAIHGGMNADNPNAVELSNATPSIIDLGTATSECNDGPGGEYPDPGH